MRHTMPHECRQQVLEHVITLGHDATWTTHDIAASLACHEPSVRAAVGWLLAGGLITVDGRECRRTRNGDRYYATRYRWLGSESIIRVPRDRDARRRACAHPPPSTAGFWLSRAWSTQQAIP